MSSDRLPVQGAADAAAPDRGLTIRFRVTPVLPAGRRGEGVTLCLGRFQTRFGPVLLLGEGGALWGLALSAEIGEDAAMADMAARWPMARIVEAPEAMEPILSTLLRGAGELRVVLTGSDFQQRVWRALAEVPYGQRISYGQLADRIGQPRAVRAVASAVGQNPVAWVLPCHRVTRAGGDGSGGGFHWGLSIKRAMLAAERDNG
ncbi:methylated-DNA--[protein]-cysteine S-methyltransferase [Paracoccus pacificus]|uniref:Methylated-DNA--[protein]-cysteine S-methyltransferase n=1 Tax=Paracoccus pacificus TaxID=1463598 RepID=A0ABW4R704_9RHOB